MPNIVADFWTYCSCYEIPRNYAIWSALSMIASATGRRVYIRQGDIIHHANLYVCLVGHQGGRKSVSKDFARDFFTEVFPDAVVGAAMQSREAIATFLSSPESIRTYHDENGVLVEWHPISFFINELKNFLSYNPAGMIEFLTDIYDRKYFDASTIKRGLEKIPNPCINILACETADWIVDRLKSKVVTGGFSRRMLYVYVLRPTNTNDIVCIPRPVVTDTARLAKERVLRQLEKIPSCVGEFVWTPDGERAFDNFYRETKFSFNEDPVIQGYRETKDVQLLKLCMLLALAEENPRLQITEPLITQGLAVLDTVEENLAKLSVAAGRNELAVPMQRVTEILAQNNGIMPEKKLMQKLLRDLSPYEQQIVLPFLRQTDIIVTKPMDLDGNGVTKMYTMLPEVWTKLQQTGGVK